VESSIRTSYNQIRNQKNGKHLIANNNSYDEGRVERNSYKEKL